MKEIFDWLREQINEGREFEHDERNECFNNALDYAIRRVDEAEAKWKERKAELRANVIDEFAEKLKMASIRGTFEHKPDKEKPWYKVRSYCKVVGTRKIDEIASQMKGEKE